MNRFYQHFKSNPTPEDPFNGIYEVIGLTIDHENTSHIIYRSLEKKFIIDYTKNIYEGFPTWYSQPKERFFGDVKLEENLYISRFVGLGDIHELRQRSKELYGTIDRNN